MTRKELIDTLIRYVAFNSHEEKMKSRFLTFVRNNEDCFKRELLIGHLTASCWVMNEKKDEVLLIHHVKLDKWLQPGGHCDRDENVYRVAKKELEEETGLIPILDNNSIFDLDIHTIPERKGIAEHEHFDIRFLFVVNRLDELVYNHETKGMKWLKLNDISNYNSEESVLRMRDKVNIN
jgi:8-oxo-dGTP pyrophosphatase MutT (NUDIX family)